MPSPNKRTLFTPAVLGILAVVFCGSVFALISVPRYRWRVEIVRLKAIGALPDITWKELFQLNRHGDPFNLKKLVTIPSPYLVIKNPFASAEDVSAGERIFQLHCTVCHAANGVTGGVGPTLEGRQMRKGSSDWAMFKTISKGIAGTSMPPSTLPENDRWRLVAYVQSLAHGAETHADSVLNSKIASLRSVRYEDILA